MVHPQAATRSHNNNNGSKAHHLAMVMAVVME
jgi:hypothetical protein